MLESQLLQMVEAKQAVWARLIALVGFSPAHGLQCHSAAVCWQCAGMQ